MATTTDVSNVKQTDSLDGLTLILNREPKGTLFVLDFWASWSEPSLLMNGVALELAKQHAAVVFVKVEAENAPDVSEKFDIEAVPTFVLVQSGKIVERINGANAAELTSKVVKFAAAAAPPAASAAPAPAAPKKDAAAASAEPFVLTEEHKARFKTLTSASACVAFIKGTPTHPRCGFSRQLIELFDRNNIQWSHFNILDDDDVRAGLKVYSDWPTFPQVYVNGDLVGGLDIMKEMESNGDLAGIFPKKTSVDINSRLKQLINQSPVVLFMKGVPEAPQCGFSKQIVAILNETGVKYSTFDILKDEAVRQGLKTFSNWPTFPQLYVKGELIGGLDIVKELKDSGELQQTLEA